MDPYRFRPTLTALEDRRTPSITPTDVFNSVAAVQFTTDSLRNLLDQSGSAFASTSYTLYATVLPQLADQNRAAASVLTEFQSDMQTRMAGNASLTAFLKPFVSQTAGLTQAADVNAAYSDVIGQWFGAPPHSASVPTTPTTPVTPVTPTTPPALSTTIPTVTAVAQPNGLKVQDVFVGSGPAVTAGSTVTVNYTGWLASDGTQFDSSNGTPRQFSLNGVIQGWQLGVPGMQPGGIRRLFVPSALGYGSTGSGSTIPPDSDLVFEIQLVSSP